MRKKLLSMLALLCLTVASAWAKTVTFTITSEDLMGAMGGFITKDGVFVSASMIGMDGIQGPGSFSTSEGNFTKIVITPEMVNIEGEGWDRNTWEGTPSSTVPFEGTIDGMGDDIMIECTIETEIPLSISPNTMQTFRVDEIVAFTANTDKDVKWSVGGTDVSAIALYSNADCTVPVGTDATSTKTVYAKGVSVGSATVTVTTADNVETASCDVTVKGPKWNGGTHTAIDNEDLGAITVTGDATLTINEGVTVTVSGGINVTSGTLTVNGLGTLVVNGANGNSGIDPGDGAAAISGNVIVQGATVTATGGQGGMGTTVSNAGNPGANGGAAFSGAVTIYSGTITANGGKGGKGGFAIYSGKTGGNGGNGGAAFSSTSTLTYYGGNVTANGGARGARGDAISGASSGSAGNPGNAFASNSVTLATTPATLTGDGSDITIVTNPTVTGYQTVSISAPVASWVGNSAINANDTWYYAGNNFGWCTGGAFNGADLGTITTLSLGGQSQAWADGNANWNDGNLTMTMGYKIDGGADESLSLNWFEFADNNNKFQSGGSSWATQDIDISGLTPGNHTIAVWFTRDGKWDSNNSANYVASFTIPVPATYDVTANLANGAYWATFYSDAGNYQAPEGTQVFAVKLTGTAIEMTEITDRIVKSGEGVVLKQATESSTATTTITLTKTDSGNNTSYANSLTGTMTDITNPGNAYVLGNGSNGVGFYRLASDGTIGANKAYLTYSGSEARQFFGFDEATGIESIDHSPLTIDHSAYDLQGRRVAQPTKGLYIVNGKKVIK